MMSSTSTTARSKPSVNRVRTRGWMVMMAGIGICGALSIDSYVPAFPALAHQLHATTSMVQLTLTTYFIGTLVGLIVTGPLTDALGRKPLLVLSMLLFTVSSALCAVAPSILALAAIRAIQGFAVAVGSVIRSAAVRDVTSGEETAHVLSTLLMLVMVSPVVAPLLGSQLLLLGSWRWIFVALAVFGVCWTAVVAIGFKETLRSDQRAAHDRTALGSFMPLLRSRGFLCVLLLSGLADGAFYVYLADGSPVMQGTYGLSPQTFALIFAINAVGIAAGLQVNKWLLGRRSTGAVTRLTLAAGTAAGVLLVATAVMGTSVLGVIAPMLVLVAMLGVTYPNSTALAVAEHPLRAGTAASLVSFVQTAIGAVLAPIAGLAGTTSAVPLFVMMTVMTAGAAAVAVYAYETR